MRFITMILGIVLGMTISVFAQEGKTQPPRPISIKLKTGETLKGELVKVDPSSVDFTVKNILQSVALDEVESIRFDHSAEIIMSSTAEPAVILGSKELRPVITCKEKARYTNAAYAQKIEGSVVINAVFRSDGSLSNLRVVRGLPFGLTESAIEAAKKIKFEPAKKDGKPVNVRGNLEYKFELKDKPSSRE